jgi:hypothetical protein
MIEDLKTVLKKEFGLIADKFNVLSLLPEDRQSKDEIFCKPGVYVFYKGDRIWKIGKHNSNARKRALEHFRDDTGSNIGNGMKKFEHDQRMHLSLFLLKDNKDVHWIYALECFFENKFRSEEKLEIPSKRI